MSRNNGIVVFFNSKKNVGLVCDKDFQNQYFFTSKKKFKHGDNVEFSLKESDLNGLLGTQKLIANNVTKIQETK